MLKILTNQQEINYHVKEKGDKVHENTQSKDF